MVNTVQCTRDISGMGHGMGSNCFMRETNLILFLAGNPNALAWAFKGFLGPSIFSKSPSNFLMAHQTFENCIEINRTWARTNLSIRYKLISLQ